MRVWVAEWRLINAPRAHLHSALWWIRRGKSGSSGKSVGAKATQSSPAMWTGRQASLLTLVHDRPAVAEAPRDEPGSLPLAQLREHAGQAPRLKRSAALRLPQSMKPRLCPRQVEPAPSKVILPGKRAAHSRDNSFLEGKEGLETLENSFLAGGERTEAWKTLFRPGGLSLSSRKLFSLESPPPLPLEKCCLQLRHLALGAENAVRSRQTRPPVRRTMPNRSSGPGWDRTDPVRAGAGPLVNRKDVAQPGYHEAIEQLEVLTDNLAFLVIYLCTRRVCLTHNLRVGVRLERWQLDRHGYIIMAAPALLKRSLSAHPQVTPTNDWSGMLQMCHLDPANCRDGSHRSKFGAFCHP